MAFPQKTPSVSTDSAQIDELLTRGVECIFPSTEFLEKELVSGRRLSLYLGIDPTAPSLHVGHVIPLLKLRQFQDLGHRVILLIGDFTGMVGDPSGKTATRKRLTRDEVLGNAKEYKKQASRVLSFGGPNPAELKYNSEWLGKLSFADSFDILSRITHAQAIKRDMFQERIAEGKDLYLHELLYPMMQGYDSVAMEVDGEVGGNDQTFNMLVGRDLLKKMKGKEKFVIATKMLADSSGRKMGKTEGNMVAFSDEAGDAFGKIMSWPDSMILSGFELCTRVPLPEIERMKKELEAGVNPKDLKLRLAEEVVALLQSAEAAKKARAEFGAAFSEGKPTEFTLVSCGGRETGAALVEAGIVSSKSELRRLISKGAVTNLDTGEKVGEAFLKSAPTGQYRIGKHRFIKVSGGDTE